MKSPAEWLADLSDETVDWMPVSILCILAACLVGAIEWPFRTGWNAFVRWWMRGERFRNRP